MSQKKRFLPNARYPAKDLLYALKSNLEQRALITPHQKAIFRRQSTSIVEVKPNYVP